MSLLRRAPSELGILKHLEPHTRAHVLRLLAVHPGLTLTSGRRSAARNSQVGGSPTSWHLRGRAIDATGPLPLLQVAATVAWRQRISPSCTGPEEVLLEFAGTARQHLHVAW